MIDTRGRQMHQYKSPDSEVFKNRDHYMYILPQHQLRKPTPTNDVTHVGASIRPDHGFGVTYKFGACL